jgi:hypothetical protein
LLTDPAMMLSWVKACLPLHSCIGKPLSLLNQTLKLASAGQVWPPHDR